MHAMQPMQLAPDVCLSALFLANPGCHVRRSDEAVRVWPIPTSPKQQQTRQWAQIATTQHDPWAPLTRSAYPSFPSTGRAAPECAGGPDWFCLRSLLGTPSLHSKSYKAASEALTESICVVGGKPGFKIRDQTLISICKTKPHIHSSKRRGQPHVLGEHHAQQTCKTKL